MGIILNQIYHAFKVRQDQAHIDQIMAQIQKDTTPLQQYDGFENEYFQITNFLPKDVAKSPKDYAIIVLKGDDTIARMQFQNFLSAKHININNYSLDFIHQ